MQRHDSKQSKGETNFATNGRLVDAFHEIRSKGELRRRKTRWMFNVEHSDLFKSESRPGTSRLRTHGAVKTGDDIEGNLQGLVKVPMATAWLSPSDEGDFFGIRIACDSK
jgi:hypothetical protein